MKCQEFGYALFPIVMKKKPQQTQQIKTYAKGFSFFFPFFFSHSWTALSHFA